MAWRNHETHKEETKAVKEALAKAGINAKVGHGKGTAWGWLHVNIGAGQQFGEHEHAECSHRRMPMHCRRCREMERLLETAEKITREVTGRHGEYGGEINYYTQDEWNNKKNCSEPITHPNWKIEEEAEQPQPESAAPTAEEPKLEPLPMGKRYFVAERFAPGNVKDGETFSCDAPTAGAVPLLIEFAGWESGRASWRVISEGFFHRVIFRWSLADCGKNVYILVPGDTEPVEGAEDKPQAETGGSEPAPAAIPWTPELEELGAILISLSEEAAAGKCAPEYTTQARIINAYRILAPGQSYPQKLDTAKEKLSAAGFSGLKALETAYREKIAADSPQRPAEPPQAQPVDEPETQPKSDWQLRREARAERFRELAANARGRSSALHADSRRMMSAIPMGQPILIGHHSEGRDRRYRERAWNKLGAAVKEADKASYYEQKAQAAENNQAIFSDDPDAVQKLEEKIEQAKAYQAKVIAANKIIRRSPKNEQTPGKVQELAELLGYPAEKVAKLFTPDFCGRIGFPDYVTKNNGANIRRMEERFESLQKLAEERQRAEETGESEKAQEFDGFKVVENIEENRIQIIFPGKPEEAIRERLKGEGFRWSPYNKAWQRHLNNAGRYAASCIINYLTKEPTAA
jgi:hypothetical protein